ncbi:MAG: flagellar hook-associated protein FlgK [Bacillota bacterium]
MSIFGSFEIGRKALRAQQKGMDVSGQNVANANTPGYSRQRVDLAAVVPPAVAGVSMSPGNGVVVNDILRVRSEFYYTQLLNTTSHKAYWEMRRETFLGAEVIFMEPQEYGINQYLGDFFDTWNELSSSPESMAVRMGLREQAVSLASLSRDVYLRLQDLKINLQDELTMRVSEVNRLAGVLSELNDQARFVSALGQKSNELLDQIDLALEELSLLVDIRVNHKANGTVEVFAGGRLLVQEEHNFPIKLKYDQEVDRWQLVSYSGSPLALSSGRMFGLLDAVNKDIPSLQGELDRIVENLVTEVNRIHRSGFGLDGETGNDFFKEIADNGIPASLQFAVHDSILENAGLIAAASRADEPGNGENALAVARLRDARMDGLDGSSVIDYYRGFISALGVEGRESERMTQAYHTAESQLREKHLSIAGVSLDEEMLNMIQYQHAWNAAARYLSYVDQMLATLFHELGR